MSSTDEVREQKRESWDGVVERLREFDGAPTIARHARVVVATK